MLKSTVNNVESSITNVESKLEDVESVVITIDRTIRKKQDKQKIKRTTTIPNNTHAEHGQLPNNRTFANNTHAEEHGQISNNSTFVELFKISLTYDSLVISPNNITDFVQEVVPMPTNAIGNEYNILLDGSQKHQTNKCARFIKTELQ